MMNSSGFSKNASLPTPPNDSNVTVHRGKKSGLELSSVKFENDMELRVNQLQLTAHAKRLKVLRKELEYIQSTDWKYQDFETNFLK